MKDETNGTSVEAENSVVPPLDEQQQKTADKIIQDITGGMTESDAAILNKSRTTWHVWKKAHPELQDLVDEAKLKYKQTLIMSVNVNSVKSGIVGLEMLRRRFPKEYNVPLKNDLTSKGQKLGGVIVLPSNGRDNPTTDGGASGASTETKTD